ncbi:hypothetical protein [Thermomonospora curvata]|uniref:hypothetical protein n=1 Tax=Thermomonospora curvata TaxID=2020 RepID=UPI000324CF3A|nr:hypothetical protein [Thermomonospora curvata]
MCLGETSPDLPRCSHCNAQLDQATAVDSASTPQASPPAAPPQEEQTRQDQPQGDLTRQDLTRQDLTRQDLTRQDQPWQGRSAPEASPPGDPASWSPGPWTVQHGREAAPGSSTEEITSLSPEPWNDPQAWSGSPPMWQPPPPRKRNKVLPYVLAGVAAWVLAAVALAIIYWPQPEQEPDTLPQQSQQALEQTQGGQSAPPTGAEEQSPTPDADDDAGRRQAEQIDALLRDMAGTRSELGAVVSAGCDVSGLERVRDQRREQLATAETLQVDALPDGDALKNALTEALRASIESNELYLRYAPGCPSDSAAEEVNNRATRAKSEVVGYWNAIASEYGLPSRDSGSI